VAFHFTSAALDGSLDWSSRAVRPEGAMTPRDAGISTLVVVAIGVGIALAMGCSMPLRVARVSDPAEPVRGVRFLVKRPAYEAALRLDESDAHACRFRLLLSQNLEGAPLEYEAVGETRVFSTTEFRVTQDASGGLDSISAGEKDQLHEAVLAVAEVAVSLASPIATETDEKPACEPPHDDEGRLARYVVEHRRLAERLARVEDARSQRLASIGPRTSSATLRAIDGLEDRIAQLAEELDDHRYPLRSGQIRLYLDGRRIHPAEEPEVPAWFEVKLVLEGPA
jgi:hypothetical protein